MKSFQEAIAAELRDNISYWILSFIHMSSE